MHKKFIDVGVRLRYVTVEILFGKISDKDIYLLCFQIISFDGSYYSQFNVSNIFAPHRLEMLLFRSYLTKSII